MIAAPKKPDLSSLNHSGLYDVARNNPLRHEKTEKVKKPVAVDPLTQLRRETEQKARRRRGVSWWSFNGTGSRTTDILVVLGFLFAFTVLAAGIMIAFR